MPMLLLSELDAARSCCSWLVCSASVWAMLCLRICEPLLLVIEVVLGVVEGLRRHEAPLGQRLLQLILPARLGEVGLGLVEVAQVGVAGLGQRQLLAAHVVELLLDLGLLLERRELQFGIRQDRQQLALRDLRAVLDQLLLDAAALDRVEIDGDQRRHPRPQREEILERAATATVAMVSRSRLTDIESDARREQPEDEDQQQERAAAAPPIRIRLSMRLRTTTRSIAPPVTASERSGWRSSTRLTVHLRAATVRKRTAEPPPARLCPLERKSVPHASCP